MTSPALYESHDISGLHAAQCHGPGAEPILDKVRNKRRIVDDRGFGQGTILTQVSGVGSRKALDGSARRCQSSSLNRVLRSQKRLQVIEGRARAASDRAHVLQRRRTGSYNSAACKITVVDLPSMFNSTAMGGASSCGMESDGTRRADLGEISHSCTTRMRGCPISNAPAGAHCAARFFPRGSAAVCSYRRRS